MNDKYAPTNIYIVYIVESIDGKEHEAGERIVYARTPLEACRLVMAYLVKQYRNGNLSRLRCPILYGREQTKQYVGRHGRILGFDYSSLESEQSKFEPNERIKRLLYFRQSQHLEHKQRRLAKAG